jgi:hypothetical protein
VGSEAAVLAERGALSRSGGAYGPPGVRVRVFTRHREVALPGAPGESPGRPQGRPWFTPGDEPPCTRFAPGLAAARLTEVVAAATPPDERRGEPPKSAREEAIALC